MRQQKFLRFHAMRAPIPRYFIIAVTVLCWFAALIQCLQAEKNTVIKNPFLETTVPAYSTHRSHRPTHSVSCIYSHETNDYTDYYLYDPDLEAAGIQPVGQGYNIHMVMKKNGQAYFGFPTIDCDY